MIETKYLTHVYNQQTAILLLRIDDIVSGSKKRDQLENEKKQAAMAQAAPTEESVKDDQSEKSKQAVIEV